ncbi:ABC transporter substrate-binding protein [Natronomonas marina]|uniref:ABC transporter substrate-binding protein n=1 Tax=Natronomonas marina TaxID=2961939 RepID=UPI0020C987BE|nr:ABC transporter substrate-binding protein [Natronomonas marina]
MRTINVDSVSRRTALKSVPAGLATASLAGCLGNSGGEELRIGSTLPLSGPYGFVGENCRDGIELAVAHANEDGDAGRDVSVEFADTETQPGTGRTRAQELINDGVDLLVGNFSSAVGLSISDLANQEDVPYGCIGGNLRLTGADCRPGVYNFGNSTLQQASSGLRYVLDENGGEIGSIYEIAFDYSWGQNVASYHDNTLLEEYDVELLGRDFVPLGTQDFSAQLTSAADSGADAVSFVASTAQLINQAQEFGIYEDFIASYITTPIISMGAVNDGILGHENFYPGGLSWYWQIDTEPSNRFGADFREEYETVPLSYAANLYVGTRTMLSAVAEAGSAETADLQPVLEGTELFPQMWGHGETMRACDHRAKFPTPVVRSRPADEVDSEEQNWFEIVEVPTPLEDAMRPCGETGCDLS